MEAAVDARDAELLGQLVRERLGGDGAAAAGLLSKAAEAVLSPSKKLAQRSPQSERKDLAAPEAVEAAAEVPAELLRLPGVSLAVPRGRFDVVLDAGGLTLQGGKAGVLGPMPWGSVLHVLRVPKPESYSRTGAPRAYYLVLPLGTPLQVGKQALGCLVFNADGVKPLAANAVEAVALCGSSGSQDSPVAGRLVAAAARVASGQAEHAALAQLLAAPNGKAVEEPDRRLCPVEWVRAHRGVDEGAIYPLRAGLCFLPKPAIFIPAASIAGIRGGRCGSVHVGASLTDVMVERADGVPAEVFSNVVKDHAQALTDFANGLGAGRAKERGRSSASSSNKAGAVATRPSSFAPPGGSKDDYDEEADEDFEPDDSESGEDATAAVPVRASARVRKRSCPTEGAGPTPRRTRARAAAAAAAEGSSVLFALSERDLSDAASLPSDGEDLG